jgi:hypothetical protein
MGTSNVQNYPTIDSGKKGEKYRQVKSTIPLTVLVVSYVLIIINASEFQS